MKTIIENETASVDRLPHLRDRLRHPHPAHRHAVHLPVAATGGEAMSAPTLLFDAPGPRPGAGTRPHRCRAARGRRRARARAVEAGRGPARAGDVGAASHSPATCGPSTSSPGSSKTLQAAAVSIVLALVFGLVFGMGRLSHLAPVRWFCGVVVEFFRAVPVLLMMYFAFGVYAANNVFGADYNAFYGVVTGADALQRLGHRRAGALRRLLAAEGPVRGRAVHRPHAAGRRCGRSSCRRRSPRCCPRWSASSSSSSRTARSAPRSPTPSCSSRTRRRHRLRGRHPGLRRRGVIFILLNYGLTVVAGRVERRINRRGRTAGGTITNGMPGAPGGPGAMPSTGVAGTTCRTSTPGPDQLPGAGVRGARGRATAAGRLIRTSARTALLTRGFVGGTFVRPALGGVVHRVATTTGSWMSRRLRP